jgi:hypothetical protein
VVQRVSAERVVYLVGHDCHLIRPLVGRSQVFLPLVGIIPPPCQEVMPHVLSVEDVEELQIPICQVVEIVNCLVKVVDEFIRAFQDVCVSEQLVQRLLQPALPGQKGTQPLSSTTRESLSTFGGRKESFPMQKEVNLVKEMSQ